MTLLDHPPWSPERTPDDEFEPVDTSALLDGSDLDAPWRPDAVEPLDELGLGASDLAPLWPAPPRPRAPRPPTSVPLSRPPSRPWRRSALLVALAVVGGVAGGAVVRLTDRPDAPTTVVAAPAPATTASPGTAGTTGTAGTATTATGATGVTGAAGFDVPAVIEHVGASVVTIDVTATATGPWGRTYEEQGAGTGFVLSADGLIATNQHVIDGAETIAVTLSDGTKLAATVVGQSTSDDLAVLHVDRTDLLPLTFGSSSALRVGTSVVAVGNALALEGGPTASLGIISAKGRSITTSSGSTYENLLQTDAAINAGDSGGPLVDRDGQVVGINTAGTTQAENIGFAIPIDDAGPVLLRLAAGTAGTA